MPITVKLSRKFYEKLGEEVTNEFVDWLNAVDQSYRSEFRELFEVHFSRFEARLAQQTAELRGETDSKLSVMQSRMDTGLSGMDTKLAQFAAQLRVEIAESRASLIRWMLGFWVAQVGVTLSAIATVWQLLK
jgi:hypothetical protein